MGHRDVNLPVMEVIQCQTVIVPLRLVRLLPSSGLYFDSGVKPLAYGPCLHGELPTQRMRCATVRATQVRSQH